jgi:UDP-glucuronate decarboxylase
MKRCVITGGAGFLGSYLCERLLAAGNSVLCIDNLTTGKKENVAHLFHHPHFTFIEHDVCLPLDVPADEIYNFACPASPPQYQADPVHTLKTSVLGALHLLELAKKTRAKIFQASTSEVYGDPLLHPQSETYWGHVNPIGVRACYDEGKRCAETLFFDYFRTHHVNIRVGRIFNTYGPRMHPDDGRVVTNFIIQALRNEPITIYGDGSQTRSFCYVDDLIDAVLLLMNAQVPIATPFNLGSQTEVSVLDLAHLVRTLTHSHSPIIFKPLPSDDPKQRRPDLQKIRAHLQWEPKVSLAEGLQKTISFLSTIVV